MSAAPSTRRGLGAWLARLEDGAIIRAAFLAMLAGTAGVLYIDFRELSEADQPGLLLPDMPVLPAFDPDSPMTPAGPEVSTDPEALRAPLSVSLGAGGVLQLVGTIDPGAFARVEAEVAARGEYVEVVSLNSPGGSVDDAIRIGALIVVNGFTTRVEAGALCASSCPLVLAGGKEREASNLAAIGVHQIYAAATARQLPTGMQAAGNAMADAQKMTAVITRYLETTGVDPAVWLHALETPPDRLYYLSPEELTKYRMVTRLTD